MQYQILIRITGTVLLSVGCWLAGRQMEDGLKCRYQFFRDTVTLLQYLEKEMLRRKAAMTEALSEASLLFAHPWNQILCELSECVRQYSGNTFSELWEEILKKNLKDDFLNDTEWQIFSHIATVFGGTDAEVQQTLMRSSLEHIKELEHKASEEYKTKGMLYRRLSVLTAAFLILILI